MDKNKKPKRRKNFVSLDPNSTVARAYLLMDQLQCEALPVRHEGKIVGVLSLNDIAKLVRNYSSGNRGEGPLKVGALMKSAVTTIDARSDLSKAIRAMLQEHLQAYVVTQDNEIIGVLSKAHLLRLLMKICEQSALSIADAMAQSFDKVLVAMPQIDSK